MRLAAEKIKAAILDPEASIRTAAIYYFAAAHSSDPSLMSLVIQAFERYGSDAFDMAWSLETFVQTDESIVWLCRQIDEIDPAGDEAASNRVARFVAALRHADQALLERHAATIRQVRHLDDDSKTLISNRIQLAWLDPSGLWPRLIEFCQAQEENAEDDRNDYDFGCAIVDALARYPDQFAGEVLKLLERETGGDWLEIMAVRLAGVMRLEGAIARLINLLPDWDTWAAEAARWSLVHIGGDRVVQQLAARYAAEPDLRLDTAFFLENIHSDLSVETCLRLFDGEQDEEVRCFLIRSALGNFAAEAIERGRQFILASEKNPEVLEVRQALLVACKLLGERFPEFDAWLEDSSRDAEFRRAWYQEHGYLEFPDDFDFDAEEGDADRFDDDLGGEFDEDAGGELDEQPTDTIVRHDEKVGRNDPCPCGSGKKYKKCCLRKQPLG